MNQQHTPEPAEGDQRRFTFAAVGGKAVTITAEYQQTWREEVEPCVDLDAVGDMLDAWSEADPDHRKYLWPSTERDDDDAFVAYLGRDGRIVLDSWKIDTESDRYSLTVLSSLLPGHHYTLTEMDEP